jgi:cysteine desulfurase
MATRIYLDANATTPVLPEVLAAMHPFWTEGFGNPSSAHAHGQRTRAAVERARASVAALLGAQPKEVLFTSGGTEADNLALAGVLQPFVDAREPAHLITTQIEHHAVLRAAEAWEQRGVAVTYLSPNADGVIESDALRAALKPETKLVSIMLANNETGAVQPIGRLARIAHDHGALFHTDAVQAAAKLPIDLGGELKNVDLLSISGHKMYAPQGTGVLFIRSRVRLAPQLHGGPQERQRRAGTENVPGIVGLGNAADAAQKFLAGEGVAELTRLRDLFERTVVSEAGDAAVNAAAATRVANTANIRFAGVDAEALLMALDLQGIAASYGAACQSGATEPSHVLLAMGLTQPEAHSAVRFSFLRTITEPEVRRAAEIVSKTVARQRALQAI